MNKRLLRAHSYDAGPVLMGVQRMEWLQASVACLGVWSGGGDSLNCVSPNGTNVGRKLANLHML